MMSKYLFAALPLVLTAARGSEETPVCSAEGECPALQDDAEGESLLLQTSLLQTRTQARKLDTQAENGVVAVSNATEGAAGEPCLCTFDIDRTLTGKQSDTKRCPDNKVVSGVRDTAYGGGTLTLSPAGQSINLKDTFCAKCYVGIVTAGDASGHKSKERDALVKNLQDSGAKLISTEWSGPSLYGENRRPCMAKYAKTPLVVGCTDGSKQEAVKGIVDLIKREKNVQIKAAHVWHFDDRSQNIRPFHGTGFNARQISCAEMAGAIGHCGAETREIRDDTGVSLCDASCKAYGCKEAYIRGRRCQCNANCKKYNSCCSDFEETCKEAPPQAAKPEDDDGGDTETPSPPDASPSETGDDAKDSGSSSDKPCLCVFDVDRTLTGKQGDTWKCKGNKQDSRNIWDSAYGGGHLTLSEAGQDLHGTFCATRKCYVGIVTAGDASGHDSPERKELTKRLQDGGGKLISTEWCGPSKWKEHRRHCRADKVDCPLVAGCVDGTKQEAVKGLVSWIKSKEGVTIAPEDVWHFDDRADNVAPFKGTGMNARQISCASREGVIGHCGATHSELVEEKGLAFCSR